MILELQDTVTLMNSTDYKERFIAEYAQLKIRIHKLNRFLCKIEATEQVSLPCNPYEPAKVLEPVKHDCPFYILRDQLDAMTRYAHLLEVRAVIEHIDLPTDEVWLKLSATPNHERGGMASQSLDAVVTKRAGRPKGTNKND